MKTMIRLALILTLIALLPGIATADMGLKGGVLLSTVNGDDAEDDFERLQDFGGGLFILLGEGSNFLLQTDMLYMRKGAVHETEAAGSTHELTFSLNYLEVPVLLRIDLGERETFSPYALGGGYAGFFLDGKTTHEIDGETDSEEDLEDIRDIDYGWTVGGGLMLGQFFVEGRYSQGMVELSDREDDEDSDTYNQSLVLMAGFQF